MKNIKMLALIITILVNGYQSKANSFAAYPEIGKACPEFKFLVKVDGETKLISNKELMGKSFVLDFWSRSCVSCIQAFSKINTIYNKHKDNFTFISVGHQDKENIIRPLFQKFQETQRLNFPIAFDSLYFKKFVHGSVPFVVWVDAKGIVKAVTSTIDDEKIQKFIADTPFDFHDASYQADLQRSTKKSPPLKSMAALFTSELMRFDTKARNLSTIGNLGRFAISQKRRYPADSLVSYSSDATLRTLYEIAYMGDKGISYKDSIYLVFYPNVVLELSDSSDFKYSVERNQNLFTYKVTMKAKHLSAEAIMSDLQAVLRSAFGYRASVEERLMPHWQVSVTPQASARLHTKGGKEFIGTENGIRVFRNVPMDKVILVLANSASSATGFDYPFINKTGIDFNVDLNIDVPITDLDAVKKALSVSGVMINESLEAKKVIVVKDK